ncbi:hypothetical protein L3X38_023983 [Prunus dulcis]|uniref:Uncharacterized protein n=1 Tax=Prunus dulcis TaxID=3755 RepID=A0AAD4VZR8_PRUDU|nr:hypothetical protein L3X38_023983 [Prunus dulcis]
MGKAWGAPCAQYLEIGNLNQKKLKKGINSSDHSFRASNGRKYGSCRPEASSSESTFLSSKLRLGRKIPFRKGNDATSATHSFAVTYAGFWRSEVIWTSKIAVKVW